MISRLAVPFALALLIPALAACADSQPGESSDQKVVLITGASTGLGRAMAERMADNGYFVYAGARKQKDLDTLNAIENIEAIRIDVTVQAEILDLLRNLQDRNRMATLLITHDLGVVAEMAQKILVMYTGKLFETGPTEAIFNNPRHPYTKGLLGAITRLGAGRQTPLQGIPGAVPDLLDLPSGCTFHPRCELADADCTAAFPPSRAMGVDVTCACYKARIR